MEQDRASTFMAVVRITSVVGMSLAVSLGIFILLAGLWFGAVIMLAAVPFFAAMRLLERLAAREEEAPQHQ